MQVWSWVGNIPWSGKWHLPPVFLPGTFHGQRNLAATVHEDAKSPTWLSTQHTRTIVWIWTLYQSCQILHSNKSSVEQFNITFSDVIVWTEQNIPFCKIHVYPHQTVFSLFTKVIHFYYNTKYLAVNDILYVAHLLYYFST